MRELKLGSELDSNAIYYLLDTDKVSLNEDAWSKVHECRRRLEKEIATKKPIYGVSTGFGQLANRWISHDKLEVLQVNLIRSHAAGLGPEVPPEITRTAMILLANSLAKGLSGIREETLRTLLAMINTGITPIAYTIGSLGASGDLAPLAHVALSIIGEGECLHRGSRKSTAAAFEEEGITPMKLRAKEGLALINGTHFITAYSLHILNRSKNLLRHSILASALSLEALRGTARAFDPRIHEARKQQGQIRVAKAFRDLLQGSGILASHANVEVDHKVQDPYSLRCNPQVLGAVVDAFDYLETIVTRECNAVTDNPLIFLDDIVSGGNFHAEPLALPLETSTMALTDLASITERRLNRLVHPATAEVPAFLASDPGVESGYMIPHYTAAALLSRMKILANPAVVDNTPVSGDQEDHVSMGMTSATKAFEVLELAEVIVALELLFAVRALNMQENRPRSSQLLELVVSKVNDTVEFIPADHYVRKDMTAIINLLRDGSLVAGLQLDL